MVAARTAPPVTRCLRTLRTLRHLRLRQIGHHILYRVRPVRRGSRRVAGRGPLPALRWPTDVALPAPAAGSAARREAIRAGDFTFLNRRERIGFVPDWNPAGLPLLWTWNLHYHEFLWQLAFEDVRAVVLDWIARCRPGPGQGGLGGRIRPRSAWSTGARCSSACTASGRSRTAGCPQPCGPASGSRRTTCAGAWSGV